jgi:hypothetical protein
MLNDFNFSEEEFEIIFELFIESNKNALGKVKSFNEKEMKNIIKEIKKKNNHKPYLTNKEFKQFLKRKPSICAYLHLNNYKPNDLLEDKNIELWLAVLMGKISEKEKKCLENINSLNGMQEVTNENIFLILKNVYHFWKKEVKRIFGNKFQKAQLKYFDIKFQILDDIWDKLMKKEYWKSIVYYSITEIFKSFKSKKKRIND